MNERDREGLLKIVRDALIANDTARLALLDMQARLRTHGARYEGPVGEPRLVTDEKLREILQRERVPYAEGADRPRLTTPESSPPSEAAVFDPETKRQRIRDNVCFRLEHGRELLPDHGGHLPDFTLDPDEAEPGKPL
jgi:hypothetical protein